MSDFKIFLFIYQVENFNLKISLVCGFAVLDNNGEQIKRILTHARDKSIYHCIISTSLKNLDLINCKIFVIFSIILFLFSFIQL